jgi:hypothetical protein
MNQAAPTAISGKTVSTVPRAAKSSAHYSPGGT